MSDIKEVSLNDIESIYPATSNGLGEDVGYEISIAAPSNTNMAVEPLVQGGLATSFSAYTKSLPNSVKQNATIINENMDSPRVNNIKEVMYESIVEANYVRSQGQYTPRFDPAANKGDTLSYDEVRRANDNRLPDDSSLNVGSPSKWAAGFRR